MSTDPRLTHAALNRFGLGARPGDLANIGDGARDLFRDEVTRKALTQIKGVAFPSMNEAGPAMREFAEMERRLREARAPAASPAAAQQPNAMAQPALDMTAPQPPASASAPQTVAAQQPALPQPALPQPALPQPALPQPAPAPPRDEPPLPARTYREEVHARHMAMLEPLGGFGERLVMFWANHFAVSVNKGNPVRTFAGLMEREAIRPYVFGRFASMLRAVEQHPAMIVYLDNQQSIGPNSRAGNRRGRGLNENLAREILELHTLGVAGGYTQGDVTSLARIITGWTLAGNNDALPMTFRFNANMHEPGEQELLGKRYADGGIEQGEAALADIARHPATAKHIALKLAAHFVSDQPPPALVSRLEQAFRASDGDLQTVSLALLDAPEAWAAEGSKMRAPQEFLIAANRALNRKPNIGQIMQPLNAMGQPAWQPGGPNGFPDTVAAWASPEGLKTRLDVAAAIGRQSAASVDPRRLVDEVFGAAASTETRQAVSRAETRHQAIALALMSPEFQRR